MMLEYILFSLFLMVGYVGFLIVVVSYGLKVLFKGEDCGKSE